jgi:hypothetical protein
MRTGMLLRRRAARVLEVRVSVSCPASILRIGGTTPLPTHERTRSASITSIGKSLPSRHHSSCGGQSNNRRVDLLLGDGDVLKVKGFTLPPVALARVAYNGALQWWIVAEGRPNGRSS